MTVFDDLQDDDGLVSVSDLTVDPTNPRNLFLKRSGHRVYLEPRVFGVANIVLARPDLSAMAKLRLSPDNTGLKGAPVFGATFQDALAKLESVRSGVVLKSMYKVLDEHAFSDYGRCATLVAHLQKKSDYIQIETWQYIQEDSVTSYLHGTKESPSGPFTHLDGATISHTAAELESIFHRGAKVKGGGYSKQFRLDGKIDLSDIIILASAFLPNEKLAIEYFERSVESEI